MVDYLMIDLLKKQYFLFDMDGTLVDLEMMNYSCFRDAVKKEMGGELTLEDYAKYIAGVGSKSGIGAFFNSIGHESKDLDAVVEGYRAQKKYYLQHEFNNVVKVIDGSEAFLVSLRRHGKKIALATSTVSKFAYEIVEKTGLAKYFDQIITVDDVEKTKPAPDIFLAAMNSLGGNVEESVGFEDSANGILSVKNAKIDCVVVHTPGRNDGVLVGNVNVIRSYNELLPLLEN